MRMKSYDSRDGKRVWLSSNEIEQILENTDTTEQRIALKLMVRCGLRRSEVTQVCLKDLVTSESGTTYLRIWEENSKSGKYRETPVSNLLMTEISTYVELQDLDADTAVIDVSDKTVYRWVKKAARECYEDSGDEGWLEVDAHDLRRTWGTQLLSDGVLPSVVMSWGGWQDWDTFRDHYLGEFSPEVLDRERGKCSWLEGDVDVRDDESQQCIAVSAEGT